MAHGPAYFPTKGQCIYCAATGVPLNDEHVVPYALGGTTVLRKASCAKCEDITKKFEQQVARELWGDARTSYGAPTRRKRERKDHIERSDPVNRERKYLVPAVEYPAGFIFYKMGPCGFLRGLSGDVDISGAWQLVVIDDGLRRDAFFQKYGHHHTIKFRHVPDAFGRLLAKIAYCQVLTALDPGDFRPLILPYITGEEKNLSHLVGSKDGQLETGLGYRLTTLYAEFADRMLLMVEARMYANSQAPTYEIIVGDVSGTEETQRAKDKLARAS